METGFYNVTNDEAPMLVYFGTHRQEGRCSIGFSSRRRKGMPSDYSGGGNGVGNKIAGVVVRGSFFARELLGGARSGGEVLARTAREFAVGEPAALLPDSRNGIGAHTRTLQVSA